MPAKSLEKPDIWSEKPSKTRIYWRDGWMVDGRRNIWKHTN